MTKTTIAVTIDTDVVEDARGKGIKISEAAENGIREALHMGERATPEKKLTPVEKAEIAINELSKQEIRARFINALSQDAAFAKGWKNRLLNELGIKLTQEETIQLFHRLGGVL